MGSIKAKLVHQGRIWQKQTTREVLWTLMKQRKVESGVLLIWNEEKNVEGCIGIADGTTVTGAYMKTSQELGWNAMQILLRMEKGSFQYLDYGGNGLGDLNQNLKIRLTQLINVLPNLPQRIDQLQGVNTLNRIRAIDPAQLEELKKQEKAADKSGKGEKAAKSENGEKLDARFAGIDQNVLMQIRQFENKTMDKRALAMWSIFAVISLATGAMVLMHH